MTMTAIEVHYPNALHPIFDVRAARTASLSIDAELIQDKTAEQVAEALFEATNAPVRFNELSLAGQFQLAYDALAAEGELFPSLSVGDFVTVPSSDGINTDSIRVEPFGFSHVGENNLSEVMMRRADYPL